MKNQIKPKQVDNIKHPDVDYRIYGGFKEKITDRLDKKQSVFSSFDIALLLSYIKTLERRLTLERVDLKAENFRLEHWYGSWSDGGEDGNPKHYFGEWYQMNRRYFADEQDAFDYMENNPIELKIRYGLYKDHYRLFYKKMIVFVGKHLL